MRIALTLVLVAGLAAWYLAPREPRHLLSDDEVALALELSPVPSLPTSPTNAVADDPAAARFGQALFFDERLSGPGTISCATCHDPAQGWGDGRRLAKAVAHHARHTMTLWNVAANRWFFWDGRKDTLWSQALAPFEDPREHATTRAAVAHVLHDDGELRADYEALFGELPDLSDEQRFPGDARPVVGDEEHAHAVAWRGMTPGDRELIDDVFVNVGKSIAAFQRLIVSTRAPFDVFVEGLAEGDNDKVAALSPSAQRGFSLFVGRAQCLVCHDGPHFTDLEFHANRVRTGEGSDPGRALGISRLLADPFNSVSRHADDAGESGRRKLALAPLGWRMPGEFKTPTLRNIATTAPYMHEGQIATLRDVVRFYSTLEDAAPAGEHTETILQPLHLTDEEIDDLVAFLEALTDESLPAHLRASPVSR